MKLSNECMRVSLYSQLLCITENFLNNFYCRDFPRKPAWNVNIISDTTTISMLFFKHKKFLLLYFPFSKCFSPISSLCLYSLDCVQRSPWSFHTNTSILYSIPLIFPSLLWHTIYLQHLSPTRILSSMVAGIFNNSTDYIFFPSKHTYWMSEWMDELILKSCARYTRYLKMHLTRREKSYKKF